METLISVLIKQQRKQLVELEIWRVLSLLSWWWWWGIINALHHSPSSFSMTPPSARLFYLCSVHRTFQSSHHYLGALTGGQMLLADLLPWCNLHFGELFFCFVFLSIGRRFHDAVQSI